MKQNTQLMLEVKTEAPACAENTRSETPEESHIVMKGIYMWFFSLLTKGKTALPQEQRFFLSTLTCRLSENNGMFKANARKQNKKNPKQHLPEVLSVISHMSVF